MVRILMHWLGNQNVQPAQPDESSHEKIAYLTDAAGCAACGICVDLETCLRVGRGWRPPGRATVCCVSWGARSQRVADVSAAECPDTGIPYRPAQGVPRTCPWRDGRALIHVGHCISTG